MTPAGGSVTNAGWHFQAEPEGRSLWVWVWV